MLRYCCVTIVLSLLYSQGVLSAITPKDEKDYRLPKIVKPTLYQIAVDVQPDFYTTKKFKGHVKIMMNVLQETSTVVLHSTNITYEDSTKYKISFDEEVEKMTLTFAKPLKQGLNTVEFNYEGILHEDMNGFYLSYYEDVKTKEKHWMATTQFQAPYARRAFPCFDEPEFKAEYQINVTRPLEYNSLSNARLSHTINSTNSATDVYEKTPKMSTYLVAFIVSKFKGYGQTKKIKNQQYDVYCDETAMKTAGHAYESGQKFIERLSKYTNVDYYKAGIPKLYQVAIPDFGAGAMENWGLVTFREADLLFDEEESPAWDKSKVSTVIAHEFSHMWFGDMVTMEWWSSTWLNEGFAEYFSYFITDMIEEKWELLRLFVVNSLQSIFYMDSLSGALALTSSNVSTKEEISDKFNDITYSKGASIVRMMHFIMGDKSFLNGIRSYIKNNMYKNTKPSDLWAALSEYISEDRLPENVSFESVMSTWTDQPGFPVIYAFANGNDVVLTQKRFMFNKSGDGQNLKWYVPITYTTSKNTNFSDDSIYWLIPEKSLTFDEVLRDKNDWFIANLMEYGFYRVQYDGNLWGRIENVLKSEDFDRIEPLNRAQIINDAFNLARAGLIQYGRVLDMTLYLAAETDYYPWRAAIGGFSYLKIRTGSDQKLLRHILGLLTKLYGSVSFDLTRDSPYMDILRTDLTLSFACELKHPDCLSKSATLFENYKKGEFINPNIRGVVYCNGIRQSKTKENWNFLWGKFLNTTLAHEKSMMLKGLACSKDPAVLSDYLKKTITKDSGIRKQDAASVFNYVLTDSPTGYQVGYKFFKDNIKEITEYYAGMGALSDIILTIADFITTKDQLKDFEKFIKKHPKELKEAAPQLNNALESANTNLQWNKAEVMTWLNTKYASDNASKGSIISISAMLWLVVICRLM